MPKRTERFQNLQANSVVTKYITIEGEPIPAGKPYDAIVQVGKSGSGLYPTLGDAIADGKRTIFIRNGTYSENFDTIINDSITIIGESAEGCVLDFGGNAGRLWVRTSSQYYYATGTIAITQDTAAVTVSGGTINDPSDTLYLRVDNNLLKVASVDSTTTLTLAETYRGPTLSGASYELMAFTDQVRVENITFRNSAQTPLRVYQCRRLLLDNVVFRDCAYFPLYSLDCDYVSVRRCRFTNNVTVVGAAAAYFTYGRVLLVRDCEFNNNDCTLGACYAGLTPNAFFDNCNFSANGLDGLTVANPQQCIVRGCTANGNSRFNYNINCSGNTSAEVVLNNCESVGATANLFNSGNYHLSGCYFTDATTAAAAPFASAGNVVVSDCVFANNADDGLEVTNCGDVTVSECIMDTNNRGFEASGCASVCVSNCHMTDDAAFAVVIDTTPRCIINGNRLNCITGNNITLTTACSESVVSNNQCNVGLISILTSDNTMVCNNSLSNATLQGLTCTGNNMLISGNLIETTATNGISSTGSNCYVHGNKTIGCSVAVSGSGSTGVANA